MTSTHAEAANIIRKTLRVHGINARVRARVASMMDAVDVYVTDLPPWTARKVCQFVGQFEYGRFNGMTDSYEYTNTRDDLPQVKYAHVENKMSPELRAEIESWIESFYAPGHNITAWQVFNDDRSFGRRFWLQRKPRAQA